MVMPNDQPLVTPGLFFFGLKTLSNDNPLAKDRWLLSTGTSYTTGNVSYTNVTAQMQAIPSKPGVGGCCHRPNACTAHAPRAHYACDSISEHH